MHNYQNQDFKAKFKTKNQNMDIKDIEKCEKINKSPYKDMNLKEINNKSKSNINDSMVLDSLAVIIRQNQIDIRKNMDIIESKGEYLRKLQREWYIEKMIRFDIDNNNDIDNVINNDIDNNGNSLIMSSVLLNGDVLLFV